MYVLSPSEGSALVSNMSAVEGEVRGPFYALFTGLNITQQNSYHRRHKLYTLARYPHNNAHDLTQTTIYGHRFVAKRTKEQPCVLCQVLKLIEQCEMQLITNWCGTGANIVMTELKATGACFHELEIRHFSDELLAVNNQQH